MQLNAEEAKYLAGYTIADYERERETTKRVIAAVPADRSSYRPDEKSMTAMHLAWHIAAAEWWFLTSVLNGNFEKTDGKMPDTIRTPADLIAWYDEVVPPVIERLKSSSGDTLCKPLDMLGMVTLPGAVILNLMNKHSVHHRGQLSAYLRPMGAKVPSIYGSSADGK